MSDYDYGYNDDGDDEYGDNNIYGDDEGPLEDIESVFSEDMYDRDLSSQEGLDYTEPEMKMDIKAFERVGTGQILGTDISLGEDYKQTIQNMKRRGMNTYDIFKIYVYSVAQKYTEEKIFKLSPKDISNILEYIPLVDRPQYKNATCYILGYIGTNGGRSSDENSIKKVIGLVKSINENGIYPADVIRYINLWENLTKSV